MMPNDALLLSMGIVPYLDPPEPVRNPYVGKNYPRYDRARMSEYCALWGSQGKDVLAEIQKAIWI